MPDDRHEEMKLDERACVMTIFGGQADSQSINQLNRLLDEGWRVSGIDPALQRLPGIVNVKAFLVKLIKPTPKPE